MVDRNQLGRFRVQLSIADVIWIVFKAVTETMNTSMTSIRRIVHTDVINPQIGLGDAPTTFGDITCDIQSSTSDNGEVSSPTSDTEDTDMESLSDNGAHHDALYDISRNTAVVPDE